VHRLRTWSAIIVAACMLTGATVLDSGVDSNVTWPVTSNTTIAPRHCQGTILAGTGSTGQFTLILPAVTDFPSNCSVLIKNGDTKNGKTLSGFPADLNTILYPSQSVGVKIVDGAWRSFYNPGPWLVPRGGVQLYASPSGNDTNDCLTPGTACTLKGACSFRSRFATYFSGHIAINLADGTYSSTDANKALCTVEGNQGGSSSALTQLFGNCSTPTNVVLAVPDKSLGVEATDGGEVASQCLEFTGGNDSIGMQATQFAVADITNVNWGKWGENGIHLALGRNASGNVSSETILAGAAFHWNFSTGATFSAGKTISIPSAVSFAGGAFLAATGNVTIDLTAETISGAGVAGTTGRRAVLAGPGYMALAGMTPCNSFFPGDRACLITAGFQDNAGDPQTTPLPGGVTLATVNGAPFTSGPVIADSAHCGWNYVLAGGAFYSAKVPVASGFPVGCQITITNADPLPTTSNATGAKWVSIGGINGCQETDWEGTYLYPQQTMQVTVVAANTWQITECPSLWQMPAGNKFVLNWDPVNGSDRPGEADGLATGSRAFKSANNALDFAGEVMAANISSQFTVKCTYNGGSCAGQSDPLGIHWPPHGGSPIGSQGGSGIILNCNGAALTGNPSYGGFFAAAIIQPTGCNFVNGVQVSWGALFLDVGTGGNTYCGPEGGVVFQATYHSLIVLGKPSTICAGNVGILLALNMHGEFENDSTMTFSGPFTVASVVVVEGGLSNAIFGTVSGESNVTGTKWQLLQGSVLNGSANVPGTNTGSTCSTCTAD
jgi:hypothetical protein